MGETITLQRLLEMQRKVWNFKINTDHETSELVAREQLKSFGQISRIGALVTLPLTIYVLILLIAYAEPPYVVIASIFMAIAGFTAGRNYLRQTAMDFDTANYKQEIQKICFDSILVSFGFSCALAVPFAFGQIPFSLEVAILAMGSLSVGGFVFGSIPRAQGYFLLITTICYGASFLAAKGYGGITAAILLAFFTLSSDFIYRMFFFNFVQRHLHAAKQKDAAETVRLLLYDYAEQSSDWLWEVDADHSIINPSARFATAVNMEIRDLRNRPLVDLFEKSAERDQLAQCLASKKAFRDIDVPISIGGEERWWKLSGRPVRTRSGMSRNIRGVAADITSAKKAEATVARLAHFDDLTDLPNRARFNQSLARSIGRMRDDQQLAVLYLDLDNFKTVNDTLGHGAGDIVLKYVANCLEDIIGIDGMVARLGGDEFAISLRNCGSSDQVLEIAQKIIDSLSGPIMIDGQSVVTGVSIGVARAPENGNTGDELIRYSDIALYHAKKNGRGCVSVFEPAMHRAVQERRTIELDLRAALKGNELELYYQPQIDIKSNTTIGYEALLRWNHRDKGMIMPDVFIPVAEETGLIVQLGEWVIRSALFELANWPDHLSVAVNLSPAQMRSPNLIPTLVNALAASGIAPHRLELEITESVLMNDSQSNVEMLHKIRSLGLRIALDDFGTGYSSLNYLRSFPFDKIKIDRCFVNEVDSCEDCRAIIRAVTGLASSLGMVTTAEGVEREGQLDHLKIEGCIQVQGYLFGKAVPASSVAGRIAPGADRVAQITMMADQCRHQDGSTVPIALRQKKTG